MVKFAVSYSALPREALNFSQMCKTNPPSVFYIAPQQSLWENNEYLKLSDQNNIEYNVNVLLNSSLGFIFHILLNHIR